MSILLQFVPLYDGQEVFEWSSCLLDLGTDFLVRNISCVVSCGLAEKAKLMTNNTSGINTEIEVN